MRHLAVHIASAIDEAWDFPPLALCQTSLGWSPAGVWHSTVVFYIPARKSPGLSLKHGFFD
jgi:hypothetical protein